MQGGANGSNYSGINLGTLNAGTSAVDIRVGGDVVMAGQNATSSNGYAGITLYSGSKVYGRNLSFYGVSSAGVGMQLGWGSSVAVDLRATSSTGTLLIAGSSSFIDGGATGSGGYGVFANGSVLRAPTIQIIGLNTNVSCVQNIACAGIGLGWYTRSSQTTNIYTNNFKLVSDKVVLGLSPVAVSLCDSNCGGGSGSSFGIDFSSYNSSSPLTFYYPSTSSTAIARLGSNYGGYLVMPSTGTTLSSYTYSHNADITIGSDLQITGSIYLSGATVTFGANLTTTVAGGDITVLATNHIQQTNATTITTAGGDVLFSSNSDGGVDGRINLSNGLTVTTNGGNITLGGGNSLGSGYAQGVGTSGLSEGLRIDGIVNLSSGNGNISLRGKSGAVAEWIDNGAWGVGFYNVSPGVVINSGTGAVLIDGYS
ncbi:hypothetical protein [Polynucleobacter necessarius]|uniref:hypothetical protein n=1 Tax=Polynucleobacter necessarius TaxID=576610 RepID=UPI000E091410|nr:hypothetical protein [Polynucleobacter necessarius]